MLMDIILGPTTHEMLSTEPGPRAVKAYLTLWGTELAQLPQHNSSSTTSARANFDRFMERLKARVLDMQPADITMALIKMLSYLPGGFIGCASTFDQLSRAIRASTSGPSCTSSTERAGTVTYIASIIRHMPDQHHARLLCTVVALASSISRPSPHDLLLFAKGLTPVALNDQIKQISTVGFLSEDIEHPNSSVLDKISMIVKGKGGQLKADNVCKTELVRMTLALLIGLWPEISLEL